MTLHPQYAVYWDLCGESARRSDMLHSYTRVYDADEVDAEIARLREAIQAWERYVCEATGCDPLAPLTHFPPEEIVLVKIAREGR